MTFSVLITTERNKRHGFWFELPSQAAIQKWREIEDQGEFPIIENIVSDFEFTYLKHYSLHQLNTIAQGLLELPQNLRKEIHQLLNYEDLEEVVTTRGSHFNYHDVSDLGKLAKAYFEEGMLPEDFVQTFIDFSALGRSLTSVLELFEGLDGGFYEFVG
jgi:hypothetical protein